MTLEQLLDEGWARHDTQSERLARELEMAADAEIQAGLVAPFVRLATHTIGEHLADWPRALALGRRALHGHVAQEDTLPAWEALYVAAVMAGDAAGAAELEIDALAAAGAPMASLLSMRLGLAGALANAGRCSEAGRLLHGTLALADRTDGAPTRALGAATNNIAWALLERPARSRDEDALMRRAAEASLDAWRRGGDWINEELALYLNASVAHACGDAGRALSLAAAGLDVIAAQGRRPLDAARFHLLRARALAGRGDARGAEGALAEADRAADGIALESLRRQYAADRTRTTETPGP